MRHLLLVFCLFMAASSQAQSSEGYSTFKGVKTFYRQFGNGSNRMLIINGGPGMNSNGFESLAREFAKRYDLTTIIYDQRGTGKSILTNMDSDHLTLDLMIGDIEALRKQLNIDSWIVFGQSFGGMLASYYATLHPGNIDKLVLSSSGGISLQGLSELNITGRLSAEEREKLTYWNRKVREDNSYENLYNRGLYLGSAYVVDKSHVPVIAKRLTQGNMTVNGLVFSNMRAMYFDCSDQLKSFQEPVLIIQGDQDIVSKSTAERAHEIFPNSTLHIVPNSSHYGWLDNPESYWGAISSFMNSGT